MQQSDLQNFGKWMALLGELHGKAISAPLAEVYWQALEDFEWEDVDLALQAHVNNPDCGQYFPKPADIIRFIEGTSETKALKAWSKVIEAIQRVGRYQSLVFDDALIHAVLEDMGGWIKVCGITLDEMPFQAREFQKRYMGFVLKKPERYPTHLWGLFELQNTKDGYPVALPLLVGEPGKAKTILLQGSDKPFLVQESRSIAALTKTLTFNPTGEKL